MLNGSLIFLSMTLLPPPPANIRQLSNLMRYRFKLICFSASEKNRFQNCLTVSNIQLGNIVSDTFGKSTQRIIAQLLDHLDEPLDLPALIHGSMKPKLPALTLAVDGVFSPSRLPN